MSYRTSTPPGARPRRLVEPGETVRPTPEAHAIHHRCWATAPCTPDAARPYEPLPALGTVESVVSEAPLRLLRVHWEGGEATDWDDDSLEPLAGR